MAKAGIQTSMHYPPVHEFSAFADVGATSLPKTSDFASSMITLPLYPGLSEEAAVEIIGRVAEFSQSEAA